MSETTRQTESLIMIAVSLLVFGATNLARADSGACCNTGVCTDGIDPGVCEAGGGAFMGDLSVCSPTRCDPGSACGNPIVVDFAQGLWHTYSGTTEGAVDDYNDTCMGSFDGGEDVIYELRLFRQLRLEIELHADDPWAAMAVFDTCPIGGGTCLATGDSGSNSELVSNLTLDAFGAPAPGATFMCDCPTNPASDRQDS